MEKGNLVTHVGNLNDFLLIRNIKYKELNIQH